MAIVIAIIAVWDEPQGADAVAADCGEQAVGVDPASADPLGHPDTDVGRVR
jgi:hypothetical protein